MTTQNVQLNISAKDTASKVIDSVNQKLGSIGTAAKAMVGLFAFEKIAQFFTQMVTVGSAASKDIANSVQSVKDGIMGYTAVLAQNVLGNKDLMNAVKTLIAAIFPLVNVLVQQLAPIFVKVITLITSLWEVIRPGVEVILGAMIATFQKLVAVLQIGANGFLILKNAITGNWKEVTRLRQENDKLTESLTKGSWFTKIDLSPSDFSKAEANGKKIRESMEKGAAKADASGPTKRLGIVNTTQINTTSYTGKISGPTMSEAQIENLQQHADQLAEWYEVQKERAAQFIDDFGSIVTEGFAQIFSGDILGGIGNFFGEAIKSVADGFKAFTLNWMKQQGAFLAFQARIYAIYGRVMSALAKLLGNPFTAGFAALGIAAALYGLTRTLGGSSGGGSGASYSTGASTASTQSSIANADARREGTIIVEGGYFNMNDPEQARMMSNAISQLANMRINFSRG